MFAISSVNGYASIIWTSVTDGILVDVNNAFLELFPSFNVSLISSGPWIFAISSVNGYASIMWTSVTDGICWAAWDSLD